MCSEGFSRLLGEGLLVLEEIKVYVKDFCICSGMGLSLLSKMNIFVCIGMFRASFSVP